MYCLEALYSGFHLQKVDSASHGVAAPEVGQNCQNWASNGHTWADNRIKSGNDFLGVVHRSKQYM